MSGSPAALAVTLPVAKSDRAQNAPPQAEDAEVSEISFAQALVIEREVDTPIPLAPGDFVILPEDGTNDVDSILELTPDVAMPDETVPDVPDGSVQKPEDVEANMRVALPLAAVQQPDMVQQTNMRRPADQLLGQTGPQPTLPAPPVPATPIAQPDDKSAAQQPAQVRRDGVVVQPMATDRAAEDLAKADVQKTALPVTRSEILVAEPESKPGTIEVDPKDGKEVELARDVPKRPSIAELTYTAKQQAVDAPKAMIETQKMAVIQVADPVVSSVPTEDGFEVATVSRTETSVTPTRIETTPQMARHVSQQVAYAIAQNTPGTTEIKLSPEELGRVRMTIQAVEGMISIAVVAERVETGDMMRRHAMMLQDDLANLGFDNINLAFSNEGQQASTDDDDTPAVLSEMTTEKDDVIAASTPEVALGSASGLDIRL